jgi:hemerythrin-like metal-binding domain
MTLFNWKDSYSCGIESIDEQHKIIGNLINKVFDAIQTGNSAAIVKGVFVELLQYSNYHFELESQLFRMYHYEGETKHLEEHSFFIRKIQMLMIRDYLTGKDDLLATLRFLINWFTEHILKTDREYCDFFRFKQVLADVNEYVLMRKYAGALRG